MIKEWDDIKRDHPYSYIMSGLSRATESDIKKLMSSFRFRIDVGDNLWCRRSTRYGYASVFARWLGKRAAIAMFDNGKDFVCITHGKTNRELLFTKENLTWNSGAGMDNCFLDGMTEYIEGRSSVGCALDFMESLTVVSPLTSRHHTVRFFNRETALVCFKEDCDKQALAGLVGQLSLNAEIRRDAALNELLYKDNA